MKLLILLFFVPCMAFASIFPSNGKVFTYSMVHSSVEPGAEDTYIGTFTMEVLERVVDGTTITTSFRSSSTTFPQFQFFSITEEADEITINGITYIGPGSDEVSGEKFVLASLPLEIGTRQDYPLMLADVKESGVFKFNDQNLEAYRISLIGTLGHYYTMAGNYWIAPEHGIVKARYTTQDAHNVELDLLSIE